MVMINVLLAIYILLVYCVGIISAPHVIHAHTIGVFIGLSNLVPNFSKVIFGFSTDRDCWRFFMLRFADYIRVAARSCEYLFVTCTCLHFLGAIGPDWRLSSSALLRRLIFEAEVDRLTMVRLDDANQGLVEMTELDLLIDSSVYIVRFISLNRLLDLFFAPV